MGMLDVLRLNRKKTEKPYTVYDLLATYDKAGESKRYALESRLEDLTEKEAKAKEALKKLQEEIADTKMFLKHGVKH